MPRSPGSELTATALPVLLERRPRERRSVPLTPLLLAVAAVLSVGLMGAIPGEGFQLPLAAVMAALLPLQLAALVYVVRRWQG